MSDPDSSTPPPPRPDAAPPSEDEKWVASWKEEHGRYLLERTPLKEKELDAERNFDTLVVTLASSALAASVVIAKDLFATSMGITLAVLSWLFCGASLGIALVDRHWTYQAHKKWRLMMDDALSHEKWEPGAWDRLDKEYDQIPHVKQLPKLKQYALMTLGVGIVFLLVFVVVAASHPQAVPKDEKMIVNVYTTTQPVIGRP